MPSNFKSLSIDAFLSRTHSPSPDDDTYLGTETLPQYSPPHSARTSTDGGDLVIVPLKQHLETSQTTSYLQLLLVLLLFPLSTCLLLFALASLPIAVSFPRTLQDIANLGRDAHGYFDSSPGAALHVLAVLSFTALWKHAWSVPGSALLNVLAGALLPLLPAVLLMTTLTTIGSLLSTLLATPLSPFLTHFLPRPLELTRTALEPSPSTHTPAWARLTVLRLIGIVPWSGLNIACGVVGVSLLQCAIGAAIGTLPWTAVTVQIGDIVRTFAVVSAVQGTLPSNSADLTTPAATIASLLSSPALLARLALLSVITLAPILLRGRLSRLLSSSSDSTPTEKKPRRQQSGSWSLVWRRNRKRSSTVSDVELLKR